jgi:hypothetical protein
MIGPPPVVPIQISALMVWPPALSVACTPFAKVGHVPLTTGRSGGVMPPSVVEPPLPELLPLEPLLEPLLDPLDEPLLEPPPDEPLLDPAPLELPEPELLEALPASPPPDPLPLPPSPPAGLEDDDDPPQPAATASPSAPTTKRFRMTRS